MIYKWPKPRIPLSSALLMRHTNYFFRSKIYTLLFCKVTWNWKLKFNVEKYNSPSTFLYVWKDNIMVSKKTMLFSPIELKLFLWAFHTSWTTEWPITYMSVIVRFRDCVSVILWLCCVCVIISMSKYLPISLKFGTNVPQCNTSGCFFFILRISIYTVLLTFF